MASAGVELPPVSPSLSSEGSSSPTSSDHSSNRDAPTANLADRFASALSDMLSGRSYTEGLKQAVLAGLIEESTVDTLRARDSTSSTTLFVDERMHEVLQGPFGLGQLIHLHSGYASADSGNILRNNILHWEPALYNPSASHRLLWAMHDKMRRHGLHEMVPAWSEATFKVLTINSATVVNATLTKLKKTGKAEWLPSNWVDPDIEKAVESMHSLALEYIREHTHRASSLGRSSPAKRKNAGRAGGESAGVHLWRPEDEPDPETLRLQEVLRLRLEDDKDSEGSEG